MKRILTTLLVAALFSSTVRAADLTGSAARAAARIGAEQTAPHGGSLIFGMRHRYFWPGFALIGFGVTNTVGLLAHRGVHCRTERGSNYTWTVCTQGNGAGFYVGLGVAPMAAGGVLWLIGRRAAKRAQAVTPDIVPVPGGWMAQTTFTF